MHVGVPTEVKNHEYRVAITPAGVHELVRHGHDVVIQAGAGTGASISDGEYVAAGATIEADADAVWAGADLVLKVKEPIAEEFYRLREGLTLYHVPPPGGIGVLHPGALRRRHHGGRLRDGPAAQRRVADALPDERGCRLLGAPGRRARADAGPGRPRPAPGRCHGCLTGRRGGAWCRRLWHERDRDGHRILGRHHGAGQNLDKLRGIDRRYNGRVKTHAANAYAVEQAVLQADLVIGAVLVPGALAPRLVTNDMVARMKPGSLLVDIAIDQGGCFEDSRPTRHADPTYRVHDRISYCVANMPGAVPNTSTHALTNVTLPYAVALADRGWRRAMTEDPVLAGGLTTVAGRVTNEPVAAAHGLVPLPVSQVLGAASAAA
jgi:alanine dehydrogenase